MRLLITPKQIRAFRPDYDDPHSFLGDFKGDHLIIRYHEGDDVVLASARYNFELQSLQDRSGALHSDLVMSEAIFGVFAQELRAALQEFVDDFTDFVFIIDPTAERFGLPPIGGRSLLDYIESFPEAVRIHLAEGVRSLLMENVVAFERAFQKAGEAFHGNS